MTVTDLDLSRSARQKNAVLSAMTSALPLVAVLVVAAAFRFWRLDLLGFNSDEAVYTGTAASIAGDQGLGAIFAIFRAHPVLFQTLLSLFLHGGVDDFTARAVAASVGVMTVALTYFLGRRLYGNAAGLIGALILAVMPYHVVVTRQVLLDGLMTLCATGVLFCVVRYSESRSRSWLLAAGAMLGATILSKETSLVLVGGLFLHFALTPSVRFRIRDVLLAVVVAVAVVLAFPLALALSGSGGSGGSYLLWQLFRQSNHPMDFYLTVVPAAIGYFVVAVALIGLFWLRREGTWRERLLLCWIIVPIVFFSVWPVKGYQYLLPIAPVLAVLAGRTLSRLDLQQFFIGRKLLGEAVRMLAVAIVVVSLVIPSWGQINNSSGNSTLAGTGGVPGGREAGEWLAKNAPADARVLTIGPSMANILQFYSLHQAQSLSVSPNPQSRNPSYVPVVNPDYAVRSGRFQYLVYDSYTATRTTFFAGKLNQLVSRFKAQPVFTTSNVTIYQVTLKRPVKLSAPVLASASTASAALWIYLTYGVAALVVVLFLGFVFVPPKRARHARAEHEDQDPRAETSVP